MRRYADANLMYFRALELRGFRSYDSMTLSLNPGVNIFVGPNGQGKTNLIEALHILTMGHSFRAGHADVWLRLAGGHRAQALQVRGWIVRSNLESEICLRVQFGKKNFLLDQKRISAAELQSRFPSVLFSPESLAAIKEGPEQRRVLLDDVLLSLDAPRARAVTDFRHTLRSRNRLLKDFQQGVYGEVQTMELLDALDEIYIPLAATLTHLRILLLHDLQPFLQEAVQFIDPRDFGDISVDYQISEQSVLGWDLHEIVNAIRNRLKSLRKTELSQGVTLVGPQKHEVNFLSAGNDARYFCSQGQQRALILGFKMAQIMYHDRAFQVHPLLLLDDVLSELDPVKGANLLRFLESVRSQIVLTTTDISFPFEFSNKGMAVYRMDGGDVLPLRT